MTKHNLICWFFFSLVISNTEADNLEKRINKNLSVIIDGGKVPVRYYDFSVEGSKNTSSDVILFIHGFRSNARYFYPIASAFSQVGYRSFSLELPGYDKSTWGTTTELLNYELAAYGRYVASSIEAISGAENIDLKRLTIWGHSMGSSIVYRAIVDHPNLFSCLKSIVFEAPAFANSITKVSKFAIWLSTKILKLGDRHDSSPERWLKWLGIGGSTDNYQVFVQNAYSMLKPENNIKQEVLDRLGVEKVFWLWSAKDIAVYSPPPDFIPNEQSIQVFVGHSISHRAPKKVCDAILGWHSRTHVEVSQ